MKAFNLPTNNVQSRTAIPSLKIDDITASYHVIGTIYPVDVSGKRVLGTWVVGPVARVVVSDTSRSLFYPSSPHCKHSILTNRHIRSHSTNPIYVKTMDKTRISIDHILYPPISTLHPHRQIFPLDWQLFLINLLPKEHVPLSSYVPLNLALLSFKGAFSMYLPKSSHPIPLPSRPI
jgi:hypothetical protein